MNQPSNQKIQNMSRISVSHARLTLAQVRPMTSLIDKEILAGSDELTLDRSGWSAVFVDNAHRVASDCGRMQASRAVTLQGQLLWQVTSAEARAPYRATCSDPFEAMERAAIHWSTQNAISRDWDSLEDTAQDLRRGRKTCRLRAEDLQGTPVQAKGVAGRVTKAMLTVMPSLPGWFAAFLMKFDPEIGFAIHSAMQREGQVHPPIDATPAA